MGICDTTAIEVVHSDYMLANKGKEAPIRFAALAAIYDPQTIRHLEPWVLRADGAAWRLAPAVERLRSGLQIVWAPRGMCWSPTSIPVS